MDESRKKLTEECKKRLLKIKQERLNGMKTLQSSLSHEMTGDEADMAQALSDQHTAITQRERLISDLYEIDQALQRIENESYGICEETEEPIEAERLRAVPWTRLSLAGAEIRERMKKRFA